MGKRIGTLLLGLLLWPLVATAQVSVVHTFTSGTVISSAEVNANFAQLSQALDRTGGTMLGTLTARDIVPDTTATYDLGVTGTRFRDGWFSRDVAVAGALTVDTFSLNDTDDSHTLALAVGSDLTANRTMTLTTGDASRTLTLNGDPTLDDWFDQDVQTAASPSFETVAVNDTDDSHTLALAAGSNLTANRTLTVTPGDADRTLTLSGNPTLDDWFDQDVQTTAGPTFSYLTLNGTRDGSQTHSTLSGTVTDTGGAVTNLYGLTISYTLNPDPNDISAVLLYAGNTIVEAASGTHGLLAGMRLLPPAITAGGASVTDAATVAITGAPSASGANNYALLVDSGPVRIDGALSVAGDASFTDRAEIDFLNYQGVQNISTVSSSTNDDIAISNSLASVVHVTTSGGGGNTITGIAAGAFDGGDLLILCNVGPDPMQFTGQSANSLAANRFMHSGTTSNHGSGFCAQAVYNDVDNRWMLILR